MKAPSAEQAAHRARDVLGSAIGTPLCNTNHKAVVPWFAFKALQKKRNKRNKTWKYLSFIPHSQYSVIRPSNSIVFQLISLLNVLPVIWRFATGLLMPTNHWGDPPWAPCITAGGHKHTLRVQLFSPELKMETSLCFLTPRPKALQCKQPPALGTQHLGWGRGCS